MRALQEIEARTRSAESALGEARTLLRDASRTAQDLADSAAAHGWSGVAEAQEATDHSSLAIDSSLTTTSEGLTALAEITDELSKTEVVSSLAKVHACFTSAQNSALDAVNALDDAKSGARRTDAETLLELLESTETHLDEVRRTLESAAEDAAAEQSAAEAWGEGGGRAAGGAQTPVTAAARTGSTSSSSDRRSAEADSPQEQKAADVLKRYYAIGVQPVTEIPEFDGRLESVLGFLESLENASIHYRLESVRPEALMVSIAVPGERWEVEFLASGTVEVEVFTSDGAIHGAQRLAELVQRFSG